MLEVECQCIHSEIRKLTNLERFVLSESFKKFYEKSSAIDQENCLILIKSRNFEGLKIYIKNRRIKHLETMTIRELRFRASQLCIKQYAHMQKHQLIKEIKEIENGPGDNQ